MENYTLIVSDKDKKVMGMLDPNGHPVFEGNEFTDEDLVKIEEKLNIKLPEDFCEIATFFSGGYLGGISNYSFSNVDNSLNIIDETIRLREVVHLPSRFIVLAEPPESLIVMDTLNNPAIIWFDGVGISGLEKNSFTSKPDEWRTYADYFEELLEEEQGI